MIFNGGPSGNISSSGIDFNFNKNFNPTRDILFSYANYTDQSLENAETAGICSLEYNTNDTKKWDLKILKDCTIKLTKKLEATLFLVGGGGAGGYPYAGIEGDSSYSYAVSWGGCGGNGGYFSIYEKFLRYTDNIQLIIGNGGEGNVSNDKETQNGNDTKVIIDSSETLIAYGGEGRKKHRIPTDRKYENIVLGTNGKGGNGQDGNNGVGPTNGKSGYIFHGSSFGGGGGGGGANSMDANGYWTWHNATFGKGGNNLNNTQYANGDGGVYNNAYQGGDQYNHSAKAGDPNTGNGGGGGYSTDTNDHSAPPGAGGSGIVIISNYPSDFAYIEEE